MESMSQSIINRTYQTNFTKHAEHEFELLIVSRWTHIVKVCAFNHIWHWLLLLFIHEVQIYLRFNESIRKLRTYFTKALDFYLIISFSISALNWIINALLHRHARTLQNFNNIWFVCISADCQEYEYRYHIIVSFFRWKTLPHFKE